MGTGPESRVGYSQRRVKIVLGKKRPLPPPSYFEFLADFRTDYQRKDNGLLTSKGHVMWKPSQDGWLRRMAKQSVVARFGNGGELESDSPVGLGAKFRAAGRAWPGL